MSKGALILRPGKAKVAPLVHWKSSSRGKPHDPIKKGCNQKKPSPSGHLTDFHLLAISRAGAQSQCLKALLQTF